MVKVLMSEVVPMKNYCYKGTNWNCFDNADFSQDKYTEMGKLCIFYARLAFQKNSKMILH